MLGYSDVQDAVTWLGTAFGFRERLRIGPGHRSQLSYGDGALIVAQSDESATGAVSVLVRVDDAAEHCEHARREGAEITAEPADMPFGERQYGARDPWGHRWTFRETIADVPPEEWGGELT